MKNKIQKGLLVCIFGNLSFGLILVNVKQRI